MMVDADLEAPEGRAGDRMTRALRHRHRRPGRQLPRRAAARRRASRCTRCAARRRAAARPARGRACTSATSPDVDDVRAARARPRPRRGLQPGRDQLGRPVVGGARPGQPRSTARPPSALLETARQLQERRATTSGSCRRPAPRSSASPTAPRRTRTPRSGRSTRTARRRPTPTSRSASSRQRGLHAVQPAILYNHESPAAAAAVRHPQDHRRPSPRSPGARPTGSCSATSTPAATGAGRPTTSTRWSARPGPTSPATTSSRPASPTPSATSSPPPSPHAGIADWEPLVAGRPGPRAAGRRHRAGRRRDPAPRRSSAGRRRSASTRSSPGWSTPTSTRAALRRVRDPRSTPWVPHRHPGYSRVLTTLQRLHSPVPDADTSSPSTIGACGGQAMSMMSER